MSAPRSAVHRWRRPRHRCPMSGLLAFAWVVTGGAVSPARAHSFALAYVDVTAVDATHAVVTLKTPRVDEHVPSLSVITPDCESTRQGASTTVEGAVVDRFDLFCPDGVADIRVGVRGLGGEVSEALVMLHLPNTEPSVRILDTAEPQRLASTNATGVTAARATPSAATLGSAAYLMLGWTHMLGGADHLLFVLGLLLVLAQRRRVHGTELVRPLVGTITAFTVAHSLTLALSTLGVLGLPARPVELLIALSILLLAVELVGHGESASTLTYRRPQLVAFAFGLLHGFGFAGVLGSLGLPEGAALPALFLFNLGVELAQLAFVLALLGATWLWLWGYRRRAARQPQALPAQLPARLTSFLGHALGALAAYWFIARGADLLLHGSSS